LHHRATRAQMKLGLHSSMDERSTELACDHAGVASAVKRPLPAPRKIPKSAPKVS